MRCPQYTVGVVILDWFSPVSMWAPAFWTSCSFKVIFKGNTLQQSNQKLMRASVTIARVSSFKKNWFTSFSGQRQTWPKPHQKVQMEPWIQIASLVFRHFTCLRTPVEMKKKKTTSPLYLAFWFVNRRSTSKTKEGLHPKTILGPSSNPT